MRFEWIDGDGDLSGAHRVRDVVFLEEQNVPHEIERNVCEDLQAMHLVVWENDVAVACGRILKKDDGLIWLQRIGVLAGYRGRGLGVRVTQALVDKVFAMGFGEVWLSSQTHAKGFYERLGFEACGDEYFEAGIAHVKMSLRKKDPGLCPG